MMKKLLATLLMLCGTQYTWAAEDVKMSNEDVEQVVAQYLKKNPQAVFDALMAYRNQEVQKMEDQSKQVAVDNYDLLFKGDAPVLGDAASKVAVVEFMDYQCGHCRVMGPRLESLANSGQAKVIIKLLPIRGATSLYASKMALASQAQGKFEVAHNALMKANDLTSEDKVDAVLAAVGIDVKKAKEGLTAAQTQINNNFSLAGKLKLQGTPAMIFSNGTPSDVVFIPGAVDAPQLQKIIKNLNA
jgi:protein-disulfide isomerase